MSEEKAMEFRRCPECNGKCLRQCDGEDWKSICEACKGEGVIYERGDGSFMDVLLSIPLQHTCWMCEGEGYTSRGRCDDCDGSGVQLTAFGQKILNFLTWHRKTLSGH